MADADSKLVQDLAQIGQAVGQGGVAQDMLNEAIARGNDVATQNQVLQDRQTLTPFEFGQKYPAEVEQQLDRLDQGKADLANYMKGATRTDGQAVADTIVDVATGLNSTVGGIAALGIGAISPRAGVAVNEVVGDFVDYSRRNNSQAQKRNEYIEGIRTKLDEQDNANQYDQDVETDGSLVAGLKRIGRDVIDATSRTVNNPTILGSTVSQATGSLLVGGPLGKGLQAAGVAQKAAMPTAIGLMEAGGSYSGSVEDIMARSHEELMQSSPEYQAEIAAGASPEAAKQRMAHNAGVIAAAIQGPIGAAVGKVAGVGAFEAAPLTRRPVAEVVSNAIREPIEEAAQSLTGQIAQNIGAKFQADPEQSLIEGAGTQAALGAIGGLGSAAAVQAPNVAAKAVAAPFKYAVNTIKKRGAQILAQQEAQSTVSQEQLAPVIVEEAAKAPVVAEGLRTLAQENGANGEQVEAYIGKVQKSIELNTEDLDGVPGSLVQDFAGFAREQIGDRPLTKFDALSFMALVAENEDNTPDERIAAGTFVLENIQNNKKIFLEDFPDYLDNVPHDRPEFQSFQQYAGVVQAIEQSPNILKALKWVNEQMQQPERVVAGVDLNTDQGKQIVSETVKIATVAPQAINPQTAEGILLQADEGTVALTAEQRRVLRGATSLLASARLYAAQNRLPEVSLVEDQAAELQTELAETENRDELMNFIGRQIETEGGARAHQLSLSQHVAGINLAASQGDRPATKRKIAQLGQFARSQRNKVMALNTSIANGNGKNVAYDAFDGFQMFSNTKGVGVRIGNAGSESFARKVYAEAQAVVQLANDFAGQYPEFGIQQIQVPKLALDKQRGSSERATPSTTTQGATNSRPQEKAQVAELPLPPTQPTRDPKETPALAVKADVRESTGGTENASSEPVVETAAPEAVVENVNEVGSPDNGGVSEEPIQPASPREAEPTETEKTTPVETVDEQQVVADRDVIQSLEEQDSAEAFPVLTMAEAYPRMVQVNGRNWFHRAFRLPKTATSRMTGLFRPIQDFSNMLDNPQQLLNFMGQDVKYDVNADDRANLQDLLQLGNDALNHMVQRLKDRVSKDDLLAKLRNGEEWVLRTRDLRVLNLLEQTESGYRYNRELMETAVIAGLDWVMNAADRSAPMSLSDVAQLLQVDEADAVPFVETFNRGVSLDMAKRGLAENIRKFWGVEVNKNEKDDFTKGILEAVAAEVLHGLSHVQLISTGVETFPVTVRKFGRVWFDERPENIQNGVRALDGVSDLFSDLALINKEIEGYSIGEPVRDLDQTQLRNSMVKTSRQQKRALENVQRTAYKPNEIVFDFVQALGEENFVSIMSGTAYKSGDLDLDHTEKGLNKAHWRSLQGLQRSYATSFKNVSKHMAAVRKHAAAQGVAVSEMATYYKHHVNKLGRLQMSGLSNPQVDKLAREIFMPTRTRLDLSQPGSADFLKFLATIGQGIGLKTEKETRAAIAASVEKDVFNDAGKFRPLVLELKEWVRVREAGSSPAIPASAIALLGQAGLSMHGLHSLLVAARYELARDRNQDLSAFETSNYVEADGKTNGPINALMLMATGEINAQWLKAIAKGGAFFGRLGKTLNSHMAEDAVDLYGDSASQTEVNVVEQGERFKSNKDVHGLFVSFKRFLSALDANVELDDDGQITIKRGLTKNPLTITIYGSGANGIAGKVTDELLNSMYEKLSESIQRDVPAGDLIYGQGGSVSFMSDLTDLASKQVRKSRKNGEHFLVGEGTQIRGTAADFELTRDQYKALRANVKTFLVDPMREAIHEKVTGFVDPVTTEIQKATQIQSIILKGMFIREVTALLAEKKSNPEKYDYRPGEFLSQKELEDILNNLRPFSPIIDTGTQGYFMSGGETSDLFEKTTIQVGDQEITVVFPEGFSRSLSGDMSTPAYVYGPTLAGVGAIPTLNVGSGDGQMMLNFLSENQEAAQRVLHVFDGLNVPADAIEDYSSKINEAVYKTWTKNTNPVRAVADSFAAFMQNSPVDALFAEGKLNAQQNQALIEIAQTYHGTFTLGEDQEMSVAEAQTFFEETLGRLNQLADETDLRRQLYSEFDFSVDQMASGETPFVNQGSIQLAPDASYEVIAEAMQARYEQLADESRKAKAEQTVVETESSEMSEIVNRFAGIDETGAGVIPAAEFPAFINALKSSMTATQKGMAVNAALMLKDSGYRIVFGNPGQLAAWEQVYNADRFIPGSNDYYGKTDVLSKIIFIRNVTPETMVHELVHAATFNKVLGFYENPKALSDVDRAAVERIAGLRSEWLAYDYSNEDPELSGARRMAENSILNHVRNGNEAAATNEFMAYVLSNQHLAEMAQKHKVKSVVLRIIGEALDMIKTLIWGAPNKGPRVGDKLLSNLKFNTRILMATPTPVELLKQDFSQVALYQSPVFGTNNRLSELRQRFNNKIMAWIGEPSNDPKAHAQWVKRSVEAQDARQTAEEVAHIFAAHFPELGNMQAYSTFTAIQTALMTEIELNPNSLSRVEDLYAHVVQNLEWFAFRENDDPQDQNDQTRAHNKYNALAGVYGTRTDKHGRSSLMSSFLALAMTDEGFRSVLSKMDKPKSAKADDRTVDARLEALGNAGLDWLSIKLSGENKLDLNVQAALDNLTFAMIDNVGDQRSYIEQQGEGFISKIDDGAGAKIQEYSGKLADATSKVLKSNKPVVVRAGAGVVNLVATMINEQRSEEAALGLTSWLNRREGANPIRELVNDVIGRTRENAPVFDMISRVRATVQQARQQFRDELPQKLASTFTKPVTGDQWTAMFKALGKTDLASLTGAYGVAGALEMVTSTNRLTTEIQHLENVIQTTDQRRFARLQVKAKQLAKFMVIGEQGTKLLRNADAIARLLGEQGLTQIAVAPQLVENLDRLVTLYAIQLVDTDTRNTIAELLNSEKEGIEFVTNYLVGQRADEVGKANSSSVALFNHYKGHIPSEAQQGGSLKIASDSEHAKLVTRGYTRLSAYTGSSADRVLGKRSYYFAPVSGQAPFTQGVLQTVHQTASGVDPNTGYTVGEVMAGRIDDANLVRLIDRQIANQSQTKENLLPVFDDKGKVVAFERAADPDKLTSLNRSTDLAQMIGVWRGRQIEEILAKQVNEQLVDNLDALWKDGVREGRQKEFVNIAKLGLSQGDDPVLAEAARLIPNHTRAYIQDVFGRDTFMVRRDMLLDTFGARQASVGDLFTGKTRWKPNVASEFEKLAVGAFGKDIYKWMVSAEKNVQEFVGNAKTLIVVKSVIVPAANLVSNMFQLLNRGVPVRDILKGVPAKTAEISTYIKRRNQEIDLEADLRAARGKNDLVLIRKLENELKSLTDSYKRMSIWPLIQAGEFSAISNGQVTAEDLALADGKWTNFIERKVASLPDALRTPARYALITRDTALFQGLARAVQYGDFIGKAILYDDLAKRKKLSSQEAVAQVNEAFVNYNRLGGRSRQYLESIGLLWFYNYKLRIMKEAAYMLRHNPLRSLLTTAVPALPIIGSIGSPVSDNFLALFNDGKLDYSMGPGMGLTSFSLNPWINMVR